MKALIKSALLILFIGNIGAVDIESYQFIDHLRAISGPGKPEIYEDGVIFTVSSSYHRAGISFAHDGYARVYWFRKLIVPGDSAALAARGEGRTNTELNVDSGIMFHVEAIPENLANMDYRLVIDGLWTTDPMNPLTVAGPSGIAESRVPLPEKPTTAPEAAPPGCYRFTYRAPPGETVTVSGSFNNWDPFMYELKETAPGFYTLLLPLPPGAFRYAFHHRGELVPDPVNGRRVYSREGRIVSEAALP